MADEGNGTQFHKVKIDNRVVPTTITTSEAVAGQWIQNIKDKYDDHHVIRRYRLIVGLDIELLTGRIATIQFSAAQSCLIYRSIVAAEPLPLSLRNFLLDYTSNVFLGVGLEYKLGILREEAGFGVGDKIPYRELSDHVARVCPRSGPLKNEAGLVEIAEAVLPWLKFERSVSVRDWDAEVLSYADVEYACIGAYVSLEIVVMNPIPLQWDF